MDDRLIRRLAFVVILAALAGTSSANESPTPTAADGPKFDLAYKFTTGTVLRYTIDHRAAIRSTIDDATQEAHTKTESVKAWKVTDVLPSGEIEFMNVVEQVHMVNRLPDRAPAEYDSTKDKTPPPGYEDTARAIGIPLSVVRMTPRGKVTSYNVKQSQPNADKDAQIVVRLPDNPVAIGATWDEPLDVTVQIDAGGTKAIQTRRHYELLSVENGIATFEITYQVLSPIDAKIESQLVQRLMKGTVRFDIDAGRVDSQLFEVDKQVLGFAGPTSSMHYQMRMEERLTETKVAASAPSKTSASLGERSLIKSQKSLEANDDSAPAKVAAVPEPTPKTENKDQAKTEVARRPSSSRRPPSRSANRSVYGKPTHYR